jgi:hypothetical protein
MFRYKGTLRALPRRARCHNGRQTSKCRIKVDKPTAGTNSFQASFLSCFRVWLREYNEDRPHSGKYCFGKTPMETFLAAKHLSDEKQLDRIPVGTSTDFVSPCDTRAVVALALCHIKSELLHVISPKATSPGP